MTNKIDTISKEKFESEINRIFREYKDKIDKDCDYVLMIDYRKENSISMSFNTYIEKNFDERNYSFFKYNKLSRAYIDTQHKDYISMVKKLKNERTNLNKNLKNIKIETTGFLSFLYYDLTYTHLITIDYKECNIKILKQIEKIISNL
jgi:uncharacterized protein (UPF0335 family)